jgi:hypothetical protein
VRLYRIRDNLFHLTEDKAMEAPALVTCKGCGLIFYPGNTDEEAAADFEKDFPGMRFDPKQIAVLCEHCYEIYRGNSLPN